MKLIHSLDVLDQEDTHEYVLSGDSLFQDLISFLKKVFFRKWGEVVWIFPHKEFDSFLKMEKAQYPWHVVTMSNPGL